MKRFRAVVVGIRRSNLKTQEMKRIENDMKLPHRKLALDCITRWNSVYTMLKSIADGKGVLQQMNPEVSSNVAAANSAAAALAVARAQDRDVLDTENLDEPESDGKEVTDREWAIIERMIPVLTLFFLRSVTFLTLLWFV